MKEKCYCNEINDLCAYCEDKAIRQCDGSNLPPEDDDYWDTSNGWYG